MIVAGIHLPDSDTHFGPILEASERVDGKGTYQLGKLRRAVALVKHKGHAVDVGAQVGLWTRVLAREFQRVTALEPVWEFVNCLTDNCVTANNVTIHPFAVGQHNGLCGIAQHDNIATAYITEVDFNAQMLRLDDQHMEQIDLLKIDCEGYEVFAVLGSEQTIRRDKPVIVIEQKRKRLARYGFKPEAGVDLLRSWGAEVAWEDHGDWCLAWPA